MSRRVILLRGINLGARNKVPMAALREQLTAAGLEGVRSYLQSGNLAAQSALDDLKLSTLVETIVLEQFGVHAPVLVRTGAELERLVSANPFPQAAAENPKQYQVSFLSQIVSGAGRELIAARAQGGESVALAPGEKEIYAWHPGGIHVSKLASQLTERKLGVDLVTSRNWTTVLALQSLLNSDE